MISFSVSSNPRKIHVVRALTTAMIGVVGLLVSGVATADEIATCREPTGRTYFHFVAPVAKADSGWSDDKTTGGVFSLTRNGKDVDILYVDVRKRPISSTQDGAMVRVLRSSPKAITVISHYPDSSMTEIYTFFKEDSGQDKFTLLQARSGETAMISKSALLVGVCDRINFDAMK